LEAHVESTALLTVVDLVRLTKTVACNVVPVALHVDSYGGVAGRVATYTKFLKSLTDVEDSLMAKSLLLSFDPQTA